MASNLQNLLRSLTVGQVGNSGVYTGRSFLDNAARQAASQAARRGAQAASYSNTPLGEYRRQHSDGGSSSGGGDGILGTLGNIGMNALTALDMPRRLVVSGVKEGADALGITDGEASFGDFVGQVKDGIGFGDIIGDATDNKWVNRALGFAGDVLLDPLTYVTGGASTVGKLERFGAASRAASLSDDTLRNLGTTRDALVSRLSTKGVGGLDDATREAIGGLKQSGLYFGGSKRGVRIAGTGGIDRAVGGRLAGLRNRITQSSPWERLSSLRDPEGMEAPFRVLRHGYDKNGQLTPTAAALTFGFNEAYKGGKNEVGSLWARSYENLFDGMDEKSRQQLVASTENGLDDPKFRYVMSQVREQLVREGIDVGDLGDTFVPHQWTAEALRLLNGESEAARKLRKALKVKRLERRGTFKPRVIKAGSEIEIDGTVIRFEKGTIAEINEKLSEAVNWSGVTKWLEDDPSKILPRYLNQAADAVGQARGLKYLLESGGDLVGKLSLMSTDQLDEFATKAANKEVRKQLRQVVKARDAAVRQQYEAAVQQIDDFRGPIVDALRARIASLGAVGDRATKRLEALAAKKATLEESARVVKAEAGQLKVRIAQQKKRLEKEFFNLETDIQALNLRVATGPSQGQTWAGREAELFDEAVGARSATLKKLVDRRARLTEEIARYEQALADIEAMDEVMSVAVQMKARQSELLSDPEAMRLAVEEGDSDLFYDLTEAVSRVTWVENRPTLAAWRVEKIQSEIAALSDAALEIDALSAAETAIARADEAFAAATDTLSKAETELAEARKAAGRKTPRRNTRQVDKRTSGLASARDLEDYRAGVGHKPVPKTPIQAAFEELDDQIREYRELISGAYSKQRAAEAGADEVRRKIAMFDEDIARQADSAEVGGPRRESYASPRVRPLPPDGKFREAEKISQYSSAWLKEAEEAKAFLAAQESAYRDMAALWKASIAAHDANEATEIRVIAERAAELAFGDRGRAEELLRSVNWMEFVDTATDLPHAPNRAFRINRKKLAQAVNQYRSEVLQKFEWMSPEDKRLYQALVDHASAEESLETARVHAAHMRQMKVDGGFEEAAVARQTQRIGSLRQREELAARELRRVGELQQVELSADVAYGMRPGQPRRVPIVDGGDGRLPYEAAISVEALQARRDLLPLTARGINELDTAWSTKVDVRVLSAQNIDVAALPESLPSEVSSRLSAIREKLLGHENADAALADIRGGAFDSAELQSAVRLRGEIARKHADIAGRSSGVNLPHKIAKQSPKKQRVWLDALKREADQLLVALERQDGIIKALSESKNRQIDALKATRLSASHVRDLRSEAENLLDFAGRWGASIEAGAEASDQLGARIAYELLETEKKAIGTRASRMAAGDGSTVLRDEEAGRKAFVDQLFDLWGDYDAAVADRDFFRRELNKSLSAKRSTTTSDEAAALDLRRAIGDYSTQGGFFGESRILGIGTEEAGGTPGFSISSYSDGYDTVLQQRLQDAEREVADRELAFMGFFDTSIGGWWSADGRLMGSREARRVRKSDFGGISGKQVADDSGKPSAKKVSNAAGVQQFGAQEALEDLNRAYKRAARAQRAKNVELRKAGSKGTDVVAAALDEVARVIEAAWDNAPARSRQRFSVLIGAESKSEASRLRRITHMQQDLGIRVARSDEQISKEVQRALDAHEAAKARLRTLQKDKLLKGETLLKLQADARKEVRNTKRLYDIALERDAFLADKERVIDWRSTLNLPSRETEKVWQVAANKERVAAAYRNVRELAEESIRVADNTIKMSDVAAAERARRRLQPLDTPAARAVLAREEAPRTIASLQREIPNLEQQIASTPTLQSTARSTAQAERQQLADEAARKAQQQVSISQDVDQLDAMRARLGAKPEDLEEVKEIRRKQSLLTIAERGEKAILDDAAAQVKAAEKGLTDVQKMKIGGGRTLKQAQKNVDAQMNELEALVQIARRDPSPETAVAVGLFNDLLNTVKELPKSVEQLDYFKALSQASKDNELVQVFKQVANDGFMEIGEILGRDNMLVAEQGLARAIQEIEKAMDSGSLLEMIDIGNRFFKTYATLSPGFHFRNMMGATFMNASDGVGVAEHRRAYKLWGDMKRSKNPQQFFDNLSDGDKVAFDAVYASGASGRLSFGEVGAENAVNPMARRILESGASKKVLENRLVRWSRSVGQDWVEGPIRLAMALDSVGRGQNLTQASARIQRIHFDYSQMSRFDRRAKAVFPFWMFMSRNLPLQVQQMLAKPRLYQVYSNFARNMNDENVKQQLWQEERSGIGLVPASMLFGKRQGLVLVPDFQHISMMEDIKKANPMEFPRILSNSNPMYRVPLELAMDRKFFNDQPFYPNENKLEYAALQTLPPVAQAARLSATTSKYEDRSKLQSLLNYLGIPLYGVDQQQAAESAARRAAK